MPPRILTALPVYNELAHLPGVLDETLRYSPDVLVVDDGSTDGTTDYLNSCENIRRITHPTNRGYGAALRSAFDCALREGHDILVTIDCDGQHEPQRIPRFAEACEDVDIVSGSRYLEEFPGDTPAPAERRHINRVMTEELNRRLGLRLTDAFCGFKAYSVPILAKFDLTENGYAMPLELWAQAAALGLKIVELPVPLIYLEEERSFGGALDNPDTRLSVYRSVLERSIDAVRRRPAVGTSAFCGE